MQRGLNCINTWLWVFKNAEEIILWDLKRQPSPYSRKEEASGGSASCFVRTRVSFRGSLFLLQMKSGRRSVWAACWESRVSARRLSAWKPKGKKSNTKTGGEMRSGAEITARWGCWKANKGVLKAGCDGKTFFPFLSFAFLTTWTEWCGNCQRNCKRWWQWQKRKRERFKASSHTKTGGHPRNKSSRQRCGHCREPRSPPSSSLRISAQVLTMGSSTGQGK